MTKSPWVDWDSPGLSTESPLGPTQTRTVGHHVLTHCQECALELNPSAGLGGVLAVPPQSHMQRDITTKF